MDDCSYIRAFFATVSQKEMSVLAAILQTIPHYFLSPIGLHTLAISYRVPCDLLCSPVDLIPLMMLDIS